MTKKTVNNSDAETEAKEIITLDMNIQVWQLNDSEIGLTGTIDGIHVSSISFEFDGTTEEGVPAFIFNKLEGSPGTRGRHPVKLSFTEPTSKDSSRPTNPLVKEIMLLKVIVANDGTVEIFKRTFTVIQHPPSLT